MEPTILTQVELPGHQTIFSFDSELSAVDFSQWLEEEGLVQYRNWLDSRYKGFSESEVPFVVVEEIPYTW